MYTWVSPNLTKTMVYYKEPKLAVKFQTFDSSFLFWRSSCLVIHSPFIFQRNYIYSIHVSVFRASMYMHHVCAVLKKEAMREHWVLWNWS